MTWIDKTHVGDCRSLMRAMIADEVTVQCVVTSPPYWGLRDYGVPGQFGLERTWQRHVARIRSTFRLVRQLLTKDGTLWLNYGDSYSSGGRSTQAIDTMRTMGARAQVNRHGPKTRTAGSDAASGKHANLNGTAVRPPKIDGLGGKQLMGIPWRVAFALQGDGWYLRSDIIWHKPNPMPESVRDRPTKAHEYIFLMSRSERYHYDAAAIAEPTTGNAHPRIGVAPDQPRSRPQKPVAGHAKGAGSHSPKDHARSKGGLKDSTKFGRGAGWREPGSFSYGQAGVLDTRNARSVWTIPTQPFSGAHFATFPEDLVARCILASTRPGDIVLDPFMGSGTVGKVATDLGRRYIGCELNPAYLELHDMRRTTQGMPL